MLNLVQIQDRLKDMPTQAIMQYANGQNPMVPPYLALGELNRRKNMEQAAMGEQAKMQGEPPTIKQATEEQLGLMNLQKQRAMQGQQRMGQSMANAPAPVPAGVGEEPVQMASGGIARLPARNLRRDAYAGGGIVAFADNQDQPVSEDMPSNYIDPELARKKRQAAMWERVKSSDKPYLAEDFRSDVSNLLDPLISFLTMREARDLEKAKNLQTADKPGDYPMYTPRPPKEKADEVVEKVAEKVVEKPKDTSGIASISAKPTQKTPVLSDMERFEKMLKDRGLDVSPESGRGIEALRKQRELYEAPVYKDWTEGLLGTVQDIRSGQAIGSTRAKQEKENKQALADLELKVAQAEDLKAKSEYEFKRGNFDKAVEYERAAKKLENETITAKAHMISAGKPTQMQEQMQLLKTNPELFEKMFGKKDPTSDLKEVVLKEALKGWMDPTNITLRKQFKSFDDYLKTLPYFSQSGTTGVDQNLIKQADAIVSGKK